jgi:hypothetical protein
MERRRFKMKLVIILFIVVLIANITVGDGRAFAILAMHHDYMVTLKYVMMAVGALLLTMILMKVLFADFADHVLPDPPEHESETPAPTEHPLT